MMEGLCKTWLFANIIQTESKQVSGVPGLVGVAKKARLVPNGC